MTEPGAGGRLPQRWPTLQFLLIGLLLLLVQRHFNTERPSIELDQARLDALRDQLQLQLARPLDDRAMTALVEQEVNDEILFRLGMERGLNYSPVVQRRLLQLGQFLQLAEPSMTDDDVLEQVRAMGLEQSDTMVRRYLVMAMEQLLAQQLPVREPDAADIEAWYRQHPEEFEEPGRIRLSHVYVGGLDDRARERAEGLLAVLRRDQPPLEQAIAMGDVFYGGHHLPLKTRQQLDNALGPVFGEQVWDQPAGQWLGPVESAYGLHLVWVEEKVPARQKPLAEVRERIAETLVQQAIKQGVSEKLQALRRGYRVVVPESYARWYAQGDAA